MAENPAAHRCGLCRRRAEECRRLPSLAAEERRRLRSLAAEERRLAGPEHRALLRLPWCACWYRADPARWEVHEETCGVPQTAHLWPVPDLCLVRLKSGGWPALDTEPSSGYLGAPAGEGLSAVASAGEKEDDIAMGCSDG